MPLQYESIAGRRLQLPIVGGKVGGVPTKMVVDTGAQTTSVEEHVVQSAHLPIVTTAETAAAGGGESFVLRRVDHPDLGIAGVHERPRELPALIVNLPAVLTDLGIGAVLSPQRLFSERAVLLDFLGGRLELLRPAAAIRRLRSVSSRAAFSSTVCRTHAGGIEGLSFSIPVTLNGVRANLTVDTGANHTSVLAETEIGRALASGATNGAHFGSAAGVHEGGTAHDTSLSFAGGTRVVDVGIMPGHHSAECDTDGVLGMDVLHACRLALNRDELWGSCKE